MYKRQVEVSPPYDHADVTAILAAIAAIRTFLNYFLERDLEAVEKRTLVEADRGRKARAADA